jgi:hypothetical protein
MLVQASLGCRIVSYLVLQKFKLRKSCCALLFFPVRVRLVSSGQRCHNDYSVSTKKSGAQITYMYVAITSAVVVGCECGRVDVNAGVLM